MATAVNKMLSKKNVFVAIPPSMLRIAGLRETAVDRDVLTICQGHEPYRRPMLHNRDREGPHGLPPPTPPDIRVTYPAVRWMQSTMGTAMEARQSQAVEVAPR
jgi:hypothetical protein